MQTIKICEKTKERFVEDISIFLVSDRIKRKVFSSIGISSDKYTEFINDANNVKAVMLESVDLFTEIDRETILNIIRPITICAFDDIKHSDDIFRRLNPENWDPKVAIEFIRWNIIQSSETVEAWKTMPSILDEEIEAVEDALEDLKRTIVLPEPEKSKEIKESILESYEDLKNEDIDDSRKQILNQMEEISDGEGTDIIIDIPYENNVIDFLDNGTE